jgi:hypothetical protein
VIITDVTIVVVVITITITSGSDLRALVLAGDVDTDQEGGEQDKERLPL